MNFEKITIDSQANSGNIGIIEIVSAPIVEDLGFKEIAITAGTLQRANTCTIGIISKITGISNIKNITMDGINCSLKGYASRR